MELERSFLLALAVTIAVETVVLAVAVRARAADRACPLTRIVFVGWLGSFATLPYLWFILPRFINGRWYVLAGEVSATLVEALIIGACLGLTARRALAVSLLCNLASFLGGGWIVDVVLAASRSSP
jgi:hypothetical protein